MTTARYQNRSDPATEIAAAWRRRASELSDWAWDRLVNRDDVWIACMPLDLRGKVKDNGEKLPDKSYTAPKKEKRGAVKLTKNILVRHFVGGDVSDVIGLHAISKGESCRWIGWDLDNHGAADPEANRAAAIFYHAKLRGLGFSPLLYTSDDKGGFHLRVIFSDPVLPAVAYHFGRWIVQDFADYGLSEAPECFPKQESLKGIEFGNAMRLPGRHHTTEYFSEVFDRQEWRAGNEAIDLILKCTGDDPGLIPAEAAPPKPKPPTPPARINTDVAEADRITRCRAYVARMPPSIEGQRGHDAIFSVACYCLRFGLADSSAIGILNEYNARADPSWSEKEITHKLADAHRSVNGEFGSMLVDDRPARRKRQRDGAKPKAAEPTRPANEPAFLTERGNAERLVARHRGDIRYCPQLDKWLVWNGKRWIIDDTGLVVGMMKQEARALWAKLADADPTERSTIARFATESERAAKIDAAIRLAQSEPGVVVRPEEIDADPLVLGCPGGVVDFRDGGKFRETRRDDLITKFAAVDPLDADCPLWESVLQRSFAGNNEMIAYVARIFGLSLTGLANVQELFIFWGNGANGKSLILETILGILGDYGAIAPDSLLTMRSHDEHPTEIMDLLGKRLIVASETEQDSKLRVQLVKRLTGDGVLKGRFMRCDYVSFRRTFKLVLLTNNKPRISEQTNAIWRRIRLLPFNVVIPRAEQDDALAEKLKADWPAILNWCIGGYLDFKSKGMRPPAEVLAATECYQSESDPLRDYLSDRIVLGEHVKVGRPELFADYQSWATQTRERYPLERNSLYERIRRLGGVTDDMWKPAGSTSPVRGFRGIGLAFTGGES
jgi:P4 family phage/plasmid primase-like protien